MSTSLFKMGLQLKTFLLVYKKYRIIYRVIGDAVFILRIIHGARILRV
jgi:plasmid stabilization system protein ParE